ncbi:hypothetical protein RI138_32245 [Streptomyces sp. C11-1]|uniref:Uncharacterized protein n=1 Tax=Streptomyces durocortorensis TaxID=2811104 RepID=A0ABY9VQA7_9ACTN|nr:hypothetical protein [Streptomyces durocortorensis]WNF25319.1 hypothetical protein RI138_00065 [Streptomyces durocortorensis]WNF31120.1 hypothetical protein RI138_32245 [Streptomyces durocortorensis]
MAVRLVDEFVGLADAGGEVAAGVAGEGLVEETTFGGGDVLAAAVAFGGECVEQAGGADAQAVHGGGEDVGVVVCLQVEVGSTA